MTGFSAQSGSDAALRRETAGWPIVGQPAVSFAQRHYYATGATFPLAWMSTMSFRGHFVTHMPQEVHLE